eukprot:4424979-Amphidinium_carterae.1
MTPEWAAGQWHTWRQAQDEAGGAPGCANQDPPARHVEVSWFYQCASLYLECLPRAIPPYLNNYRQVD